MTFDIEPFKGAAPVIFGMPRDNLVSLLGTPGVAGESDSWGPRFEINVGYDDFGGVNHVGFSPGEFELRCDGEIIWTPESHPDPNYKLLEFDGEPLERLGFLVYTKIGVTTTGYHDDDPAQFAITAFPKGAWDELLEKSQRPNLERYRHR